MDLYRHKYPFLALYSHTNIHSWLSTGTKYVPGFIQTQKYLLGFVEIQKSLPWFVQAHTYLPGFMQAQNTFLCTGITIFSGFVDVKMFSLFYTGTKISSWICTSINKLSLVCTGISIYSGCVHAQQNLLYL